MCIWNVDYYISSVFIIGEPIMNPRNKKIVSIKFIFCVILKKKVLNDGIVPQIVKHFCIFGLCCALKYLNQSFNIIIRLIFAKWFVCVVFKKKSYPIIDIQPSASYRFI
jgi:hypothetical protein